jgi:hypothetical protein
MFELVPALNWVWCPATRKESFRVSPVILAGILWAGNYRDGQPRAEAFPCIDACPTQPLDTNEGVPQ